MKKLKGWVYLMLGVLLACSVLVLSGCRSGKTERPEETGTKTPGQVTTAPEVTSDEPDETDAPETTEAVTDPDGGLWSPEMK